MMHEVLTNDTCKVTRCSNEHPANLDKPNYHLDPLCGEDLFQASEVSKPVLQSCADIAKQKQEASGKLEPNNETNEKSSLEMVHVDPSDLVG